MAFTETINLLFRSRGTGKVKRDVKSIDRSMTSAARSAKSVLGPLAGIGAGYALVSAAKKTMAFDKALSQLAIQGHITGKEQQDLRRQILDTATATGVGRDVLREYAQGVTDATGDIGLAKDAMLAVAKAHQVTGAEMQGLGTLVSDASMKFNMLGTEAGDALAIMTQQGEMGRYTLNEMARTGATAMSVAGIAGMEGADGLREMGAMMQIIRQGFGSAEEAATGFKTMVTKLYGPETERKLAKLGKGVSIRGKSGELRKFGDIFLDVLRESKGDASVLTDIFGTRGILGTANFAKIMKDNGGSVEAVSVELDKYRNVSGKGRDMHMKFMRRQKDAATGAEKLSAAWENLVTTAFTGENAAMLATALESFATSLNWAAGITRETMNDWREILGLDKKVYTDEEKADMSQASKSRKGGDTLARTTAGLAVTQGTKGYAQRQMVDFLALQMEREGTMNAPVTASKEWKRKKALSHLRGMEKKSPEEYDAFIKKYAESMQGKEGFGAASESLTNATTPSTLNFKATIFNEVPGVGIDMEAEDGSGKVYPAESI